MDTSQKFLTFLKSLHTSGNAELLECIEKGFRHVIERDYNQKFNRAQKSAIGKGLLQEAETLGNIYAHQVGRHQTPKGDIIGNGVPAPADMITEDSETSKKRKKSTAQTCSKK